jgi:hypothetical protein
MTCCRRFELSSRPSITGSTIAFAAGQRRPDPHGADGSRRRHHVVSGHGAAGQRIRPVDLYFATQFDTVLEPACDFAVSRLTPQGDEYRGAVTIGTVLLCGPPATPENILYYMSVQDVADYTVSSKIHYRFAEMAFGTDFVPRFERFPGDDFPVPPPPAPCD